MRGVLEVQLQVGRVRRRAAGARQRRGARGGDDTLYFTLDSHGPGDSDSTHTAPLGGRLSGVSASSLRRVFLIMYAERTHTRFYKFTCLLKYTGFILTKNSR